VLKEFWGVYFGSNLLLALKLLIALTSGRSLDFGDSGVGNCPGENDSSIFLNIFHPTTAADKASQTGSRDVVMQTDWVCFREADLAINRLLPPLWHSTWASLGHRERSR
jgi:hypothetical protein